MSPCPFLWHAYPSRALVSGGVRIACTYIACIEGALAHVRTCSVSRMSRYLSDAHQVSKGLGEAISDKELDFLAKRGTLQSLGIQVRRALRRSHGLASATLLKRGRLRPRARRETERAARKGRQKIPEDAEPETAALRASLTAAQEE